MIHLNIYYLEETKRIAIKTAWKELTYADYCKVLYNSSIQDDEARLRANIATLSGEDIELINRIPVPDLLPMVPFLGFIDTVTMPASNISIDVQIGVEPWGKLELAKQKLNHSSTYDIAMSMAEVVKVYTAKYNDSIEETGPGIDITNMPLPDAIVYARHFEKQFSDFFERFKELSEYKPTTEELMAGIDTLEVFGFMNTLDALAGGDILKHTEVLKQPTDYVFTKLLKDYRKAKFQEKHQEILSKKKK